MYAFTEASKTKPNKPNQTQFPQKPTRAPKIYPQKNPHFSTILDISSSELQRLLDEQSLFLCGFGGEMLFDLLADEP